MSRQLCGQIDETKNEIINISKNEQMNEQINKQINKQIKVVAYCRVSTDKSDQLNSLETQKEFFASYCERNHLTLVHTYADEGISGTRIRKRKEFQRMMKDAREGEFEQLIVKDVSRLARNTVDLLQSVRRLRAENIETVFITSDMKTLGNSEFVLTLMGAMAQEESSNTSKRVKFGKKENAKKGRVPNLVYGYDKLPGEYFQLKINQTEAANVRRIFYWYAEEGYGAAGIATRLNKMGLKTKRNCQWSQNAVSRILQNELYIGNVVNGKEEVSDFLTGTRKANNPEEWMVMSRPDLAIISEQEFAKANKVRLDRVKRYHTSGIRHSNKYMFSTLIQCAECGYSFRRIERRYKNVYVGWVCSGRNSNGTASCEDNIRINENELFLRIIKYVEGVLADREYVIQCMIREYSHRYYDEEDHKMRENELKCEISRLQRNRNKYKEMFLDNVISREELKTELIRINEVIMTNEQELKRITFSKEQQEKLISLFNHCYHDCQYFLREAQITNEQMKQIISHIQVYKDGTIKIAIRDFSEKDDL